jgi:probable phosphoglycerate mutase
MTSIIDTLTVHFVRHGETAWNAERRFQTPDVPLSDAGRAQAAAVAETLAGRNAELILASDYARADETARIISARVGVPVLHEHALRERNFGVMRGRLYAEFGEALVRDVFRDWHAGIEEGESWADVYHRISELIARLRVAPPAREIIAVTHGGTMNIALHRLRGDAADAFAAERLENCALRTVTIPSGPDSGRRRT